MQGCSLQSIPSSKSAARSPNWGMFPQLGHPKDLLVASTLSKYNQQGFYINRFLTVLLKQWFHSSAQMWEANVPQAKSNHQKSCLKTTLQRLVNKYNIFPNFSIVILFFWDKVLLCRPDWPRTWYPKCEAYKKQVPAHLAHIHFLKINQLWLSPSCCLFHN